jgi:hypothetical protein
MVVIAQFRRKEVPVSEYIRNIEKAVHPAVNQVIPLGMGNIATYFKLRIWSLRKIQK